MQTFKVWDEQNGEERDQTIAEHNARINGLRDALSHQYGEGLQCEREVLDDVKAWASEEINELRQTIAEQKTRIEELEKRQSRLLCQSSNLEARISDLREGLEAIQSDPTNASKDAEHYLNRDE